MSPAGPGGQGGSGGPGGPGGGAGGLGAWSLLRSPAVASVVASSGLDWVCLDAQHGEHDDASVREVCALLAGAPCQVLVRPRSGDPALVGRALDAGAAGVVVPLVEDAEQAAAAVAACRYPPAGRRSWGPLAAAYGGPVPAPGAASPRCSVMVETAGALARVEEVAAVEGLDEVLVGPFDLSLSLGADVDALLADGSSGAPLPRVVAACARAGVASAAFGGTPERAARLLALGFDRVAVTTDAAALASGLRAAASLSR